MTPADVSGALVAAVRDAVAAGGLDVVVPEDAGVVARGPGVYASPVALRLGLEPEVLAGRVARWPGVLRVEVSRGMLLVHVEAGSLASEIVKAGASYGWAEVPAGGWDEWPRTWENPGFSVRYAYARSCWALRWAAESGMREGEPVGLVREEELALLGVLGEMPGRARQAERERDPGALKRYLERLAGAYHDVHERWPVLPRGGEKPGAVHGARLTLAAAARIALRNGMNMIGETPRERI